MMDVAVEGYIAAKSVHWLGLAYRKPRSTATGQHWHDCARGNALLLDGQITMTFSVE